AVNVRRRGRSKSSGDAAAGAETIVGLRPSSLSAPAAARVLLSLIWDITTGCLSYAPKGKLPAGVCLIIIGTEGRLPFISAWIAPVPAIAAAFAADSSGSAVATMR